MTLGVAFSYLSEAGVAAEQFEKAHAIGARRLGPGHAGPLATVSNLAASYLALGRGDDALRLNEETLDLRKRSLGPDHPDTLMSMHNLAACRLSLGRHADALRLNEETLALRTARLGPDHPD